MTLNMVSILPRMAIA